MLKKADWRVLDCFDLVDFGVLSDFWVDKVI
jgi:hypothetical protein